MAVRGDKRRVPMFTGARTLVQLDISPAFNVRSVPRARADRALSQFNAEVYSQIHWGFQGIYCVVQW
jgi:hypothetical protein